jgi:RNA polymerase sigma-70 factor, ECF subfamily
MRRLAERKFDGFAPEEGTGDMRASVECLPAAGAHDAERLPVDLESIYRTHHGLVWRSLRGLGVPAHAVDDAVQDVFIVVHRRRGDYDGRVSVRRWVLGIARNVAHKARERIARELARVEPVAQEPRSEDVPAPDEGLARRQAAAFVHRFLDRLDPDKRAVFVLMDVEGLSAPEVAELLEIKLNTVYSRLRVARQRFERTLARRRNAGGGSWTR